MTKQQRGPRGGELRFADVSVFAGMAAVYGDSVPAAPAEERVRVGGDGLFQPSAERVPGGDGWLCGGREGLQPREKSSMSSERLLGLSVPPFVSGSHVMIFNP